MMALECFDPPSGMTAAACKRELSGWGGRNSSDAVDDVNNGLVQSSGPTQLVRGASRPVVFSKEGPVGSSIDSFLTRPRCCSSSSPSTPPRSRPALTTGPPLSVSRGSSKPPWIAASTARRSWRRDGLLPVTSRIHVPLLLVVVAVFSRSALPIVGHPPRFRLVEKLPSSATTQPKGLRSTGFIALSSLLSPVGPQGMIGKQAGEATFATTSPKPGVLPPPAPAGRETEGEEPQALRWTWRRENDGNGIRRPFMAVQGLLNQTDTDWNGSPPPSPPDKSPTLNVINTPIPNKMDGMAKEDPLWSLGFSDAEAAGATFSDIHFYHDTEDSFREPLAALATPEEIALLRQTGIRADSPDALDSWTDEIEDAGGVDWSPFHVMACKVEDCPKLGRKEYVDGNVLDAMPLPDGIEGGPTPFETFSLPRSRVRTFSGLVAHPVDTPPGWDKPSVCSAEEALAVRLKLHNVRCPTFHLDGVPELPCEGHYTVEPWLHGEAYASQFLPNIPSGSGRQSILFHSWQVSGGTPKPGVFVVFCPRSNKLPRLIPAVEVLPFALPNKAWKTAVMVLSTQVVAAETEEPSQDGNAEGEKQSHVTGEVEVRLLLERLGEDKDKLFEASDILTGGDGETGGGENSRVIPFAANLPAASGYALLEAASQKGAQCLLRAAPRDSPLAARPYLLLKCDNKTEEVEDGDSAMDSESMVIANDGRRRPAHSRRSPYTKKALQRRQRKQRLMVALAAVGALAIVSVAAIAVYLANKHLKATRRIDRLGRGFQAAKAELRKAARQRRSTEVSDDDQDWALYTADERDNIWEESDEVVQPAAGVAPVDGSRGKKLPLYSSKSAMDRRWSAQSRDPHRRGRKGLPHNIGNTASQSPTMRSACSTPPERRRIASFPPLPCDTATNVSPLSPGRSAGPRTFSDSNLVGLTGPALRASDFITSSKWRSAESLLQPQSVKRAGSDKTRLKQHRAVDMERERSESTSSGASIQDGGTWWKVFTEGMDGRVPRTISAGSLDSFDGQSDYVEQLKETNHKAASKYYEALSQAERSAKHAWASSRMAGALAAAGTVSVPWALRTVRRGTPFKTRASGALSLTSTLASLKFHKEVWAIRISPPIFTRKPFLSTRKTEGGSPSEGDSPVSTPAS